MTCPSCNATLAADADQCFLCGAEIGGGLIIRIAGGGPSYVDPTLKQKLDDAEAIERLVGTDRPNNYVWRLYCEGRDLERARDLEGALKTYERAITTGDTYHLNTFRRAAMLYRKLKRWDDEERVVRAALTENGAPGATEWFVGRLRRIIADRTGSPAPKPRKPRVARVPQPPKPAKTPELAAAEDSVLRCLADGDYARAVLTVAKYEAAQPMPRGMGVDWNNPNVEGDVAALRSIMHGPYETTAAVRTAAAMCFLWGASSPRRRWLSREANGDADAKRLVLRAFEACQEENYRVAKAKGYIPQDWEPPKR